MGTGRRSLFRSGLAGGGRGQPHAVSCRFAGPGNGDRTSQRGDSATTGTAADRPGPRLIGLAVDVEVMNALLLPAVLGFLLLLEARALPPEFRMRGWHRYLTWTLCLLVIGFALSMVPWAITRH